MRGSEGILEWNERLINSDLVNVYKLYRTEKKSLEESMKKIVAVLECFSEEVFENYLSHFLKSFFSFSFTSDYRISTNKKSVLNQCSARGKLEEK